MRQVSAPGNERYLDASIAPTRVMKVFTVTIVDEMRGDQRRVLGTTQHRKTATYDRSARVVTSTPPPVVDLYF
ncbi:MAG: hypothetical protein IT282_16175 [Bacteroidetes bacterium]|nr:hypothetical protein [Bacteroidota bacterium]